MKTRDSRLPALPAPRSPALAAWALAILFAACAKDPASSDGSAKPDESAVKAQAESDSTASAMLLPAYELNRDASSHARLTAMKAAADQPRPLPSGPSPALGTAPADPSRRLSPKSQPNIAAAFLKRAALGKAAAGGSDSAWYELGDSARGRVLWVHAYVQAEAGAAVQARDTLVFQWPYGVDSRAVLGHAGSRAYADGARLAYAFADEDGDQVLNEAASGTKVKLRKTWVTVHGDTAWKSIHHTVHGSSNAYDSIGPGLEAGWTDSVFVGGKLVSWQSVMDGDKDGFVLTAAAGKKVIVDREALEGLGGGVFRLVQESFGAGADGDYLAAADNEIYPYTSQTIDGKGNTLALARYGDGDGDGYYFDPAAGAGKNRAWIATRYPAGDSLKSGSDSLVRILSGPGGADAKISYYGAAREYADGRKLSAYSRAPGKDVFAGADTVQFWEKWDLSGLKGGTADSSLTVTWMIPGDLGDPADDKVAKAYTQTWSKPGMADISVSELLTSEAPFAPGEAPRAGTWTREERRNPVSSKSVIRSVFYKEFDLPRGSAAWRRTDYFESGDSTVSEGGGTPGGSGTYVQALGSGARSSGTYDAATGAFADTTAFLGAKGEIRDRETAWGQVDPAKGTGDYRVKRLGGKDTATARVIVAADGEGLSLTRISGTDTSRARILGDSAVSERTLGGVKRTYAWTAAAGAHRVTERDAGPGGASLAAGEFYFGRDLSGNGTLTRTPAGKPASESRVQFLSDGSVFLDGIRVHP